MFSWTPYPEGDRGVGRLEPTYDPSAPGGRLEYALEVEDADGSLPETTQEARFETEYVFGGDPEAEFSEGVDKILQNLEHWCGDMLLEMK